MDVIAKEGPVFLQGVKFGKKIWRKTWVIVFEPSPAGIGRMEMYDTRDEGMARPARLKKTDRRVIRLSDCLSITPAPGESCPADCSAFFLNIISCTYTIAAPIHEDWISVLCQLAFQKSNGDKDTKDYQRDKCTHLAYNELYSKWGVGQFQVTVQMTEASQRCRMSGSYLLSTEKEAISLLDLTMGQTIYHWPYRLLRRFGRVKGGITIEAGRRCHTGEGNFIFLSNQGSQINKALEEAIMHQSVQKLLAETTSQPQKFASQPPSPDSTTQDRSIANKLPPIRMNKDRPCPVQHKRGQPIYKVIEKVLTHHSAQDLLAPSTSLPPPTSTKPKTQDRPKDRPRVNYHPSNKHPTNRAVEKYLIHDSVQELLAQATFPPQAPSHAAVPGRNISLPNLPSNKSPPSSPDDVLYADISHQSQPKPRSKMNLPEVPTPPSLPAHLRVHIKDNTCVSIDQKSNSLQETCENKDVDNLYINWTAKTTSEQDKPNTEVVYSMLKFTDEREDASDGEKANADRQASVITKNPADFKQTLSNILFKGLSLQPTVTPKSHIGSFDHIEQKDKQMTD